MDSNILADPEAWAEWKNNPQTRAYFQMLSLRRSNLMDSWARGQLTTPEHQASAVLLTQLVDLSHDEVLDMLGIESSEGDIVA